VTNARIRSVFDGATEQVDTQQLEFERIARELEGISAWLFRRNSDLDLARRLLEKAHQMRADSHLDRD
jgi:signal transduction histidine kinase